MLHVGRVAQREGSDATIIRPLRCAAPQNAALLSSPDDGKKGGVVSKSLR